MIDNIYQILTTFTTESQDAILQKCTELGYDPNRGVVTLDESYINLNWAKEILIDAIQERKLIQLPITVQKQIAQSLEAVTRHQNNLISGADEVLNIVNAIEALTTHIWQYGLQNLSAEVLGYQTKINQLKALELQAAETNRELQSGIKKKATYEKLIAEATQTNEAISGLKENASQSEADISASLLKASEAENKSSALLAAIQQRETSSTQLLSSSTSSNAEILATEERAKLFFSEIEEHKLLISTTEKKATGAISDNTTKTNELISRLEQLEDQVKDQLEKATGYSLFHSFQTRQENIAESRKLWGSALLFAVVVSIGLTIYIANTTVDFGIGFYLKLSLSLPIVFSIAFCAVQYSRERRLEEEYAFKSNISISLEPYRTLVEKLTDTSKPEELHRYTEFVIDSITKVFTSPTHTVFKEKKEHSFLLPRKESIEQVTALLEAVNKASKR